MWKNKIKHDKKKGEKGKHALFNKVTNVFFFATRKKQNQ